MGERTADVIRLRIRITGIVQGVGFRPFIYRLAKKHNLTGFVYNDSEGVLVEAQGSGLNSFLQEIELKAPPASAVSGVKTADMPVSAGERSFVIKPSPQAQEREAMISPDLAICADCRREISDAGDRRYRYPFTNCTNCGPRFSIVQDIPYDRRFTTMKDFVMCSECRREYEDPSDRRFHAQPNACGVCGPSFRLFKLSALSGKYQAEEYAAGKKAEQDVVAKARGLIKKGAVVAVKGIGGYHLACDAFNEEAVAKLRKRKIREDKPFAVMAGSLSAVRKICSIDEAELKLLTSAAAPIVLLKKSPSYNLASSAAPKNAYLGVMTAYAPVHCLLLEEDDVFVMTSANLSDEPIVYRDEEAFLRLGKIADYVLTHDRLINTRVDDSVARIFRGRQLLLRRSRGFAPAPIELEAGGADLSVFACGAELKSTFCMTKGNRAFMSQHIGDLENMAVYGSYKESAALFKRLFDVRPDVAACDLHPDYFSTRYAKELGLPLVQVQHHHAHIASVIAEHNLQSRGKVIGVALDGTGYGDDGRIWGGEFLIADLSGYERAGHFAYAPLPGGAKAVKEPWRLALWSACQAHGEAVKELYPELLKPNWSLLLKAARSGLNAPLASSAGRVFDTAAAMLGIRHYINYEGQAAIELEQAADGGKIEALPYDIVREDGMYVLDFGPLYKALFEFRQKYGTASAAKSFHFAAAEAVCDAVRRISGDTGIKTVVFSGGVCQNTTLMEFIYQDLEKDFDIYLNEKVPPNDGGIALGQAAVALCRTKNKTRFSF